MLAPLSLLCATCASASITSGGVEARTHQTLDGDRAGKAPAALTWIATEHIGRWSGSRANDLAKVGIAGTDLGVSFEASGRLVFLFGDSWTLDREDWDADSVGWTKLTGLPRGQLPDLEWATRSGGRFLALAPRDMALGGMNVPVEGLAVGDRTYVFFDGGWDATKGRHSHSLLAHTRKLEFGDLVLDHSVPSEKFLNVSVVREGADFWIFGTGVYRKSAVYLARVPIEKLIDRAAWRYAPEFVAGEEHAAPIVLADDVGELSVRRLPGTQAWLMTSNGVRPRGIQLRTAEAPTGPWSAPLVIFEPERDRGYGRFMHQKASTVGYDDGLSEPGREEVWGGEYGPYLVPAWFSSPAPGVHGIVYTLSSWNPYQVHLVRTWLAEPGTSWTLPERVPAKAASGRELVNPLFEGGRLDGWKAEGDAFTTARRNDGSWELCTYVQPAGDAVRGRLAQDFTVPADACELRCFVHGGSESVRLVRGSEVLRETRGRRTNDVETLVRWNIEAYRGETVRLEIVDDSATRWGFVTVRGLEIVR